MRIYTIWLKLPLSVIWTALERNGHLWTTTEAWIADEKAKQIADDGVYHVHVKMIELPRQYCGMIRATLADGTDYVPADTARD